MPEDRRPTIAVAALTCFFFGVYVVSGLFRHWHFASSAYDLGIFDQVIWHLSRFETPACSINGAANIFGDHFHPIIVLFAPLYWIWPAPETLIVAQAALLAAAIVPIYLYLRRRLSHGVSLSICAAYGFFWGTQHAAVFDVHEMAFTPLITAIAVLAIDTRRWTIFWGAMVALALNKEDLIPLAAFFGVYLVVLGERQRGLTLVLAGSAAFVAVLGWLIPWLKAGSYQYSSIYSEVLQRPWTAPLILVTPTSKLVAVVNWLAPFVFLPLGSPLTLLLIPLALERLLTTNPTYWGGHYGVPLAAILAMAAGDGLARAATRMVEPITRRRVLGFAAGAAVVVSAIVPGNQPFWDIFSADHYETTPAQRSWPVVAALIPSDASVIAQAAIVPRLSHRRSIYMLDERATDADFVIANRSLSPWPAEQFDVLDALIEQRKQRGYRVIHDEDDWIVLAR